MSIAFLGGCRASHQRVTRITLVGTYVFKSDDPRWAPYHIGESLILHDNGTYEFESDQRNDNNPPSKGRWVFYEGEPAELLLEHSEYPIKLERDKVQLLVDDDIDARFEKER
jgi:hypothetical protein